MNSNSTLQTDSESLIAARRDACLLCGSPAAPLIDLPGLPLTDSYCREPVRNPISGIDQRFLYCEKCGHGQLESQVSPATLYGGNYQFRTSESATARGGTRFFLSRLDELAGDRHFDCVLDLGCNDLFLLKQLAGRATVRAGVDPVWRGRESEADESDILLFGADVEELDLAAVLPRAPDLIVCRHTLEHIGDPLAILAMLLEICHDDALILFEVPSLEPLVTRGRFDQVFHQHLHYFSLASFQRLIAAAGGEFLGHWRNYHDWGALVVALRKGKPETGIPEPPPFTPADVTRRYKLFRRQMASTTEYLDLLDGPIYGYGAAQMLPVLAYHLENDLSCLSAIIDDDPDKDGLGYWNLPVKVIHGAKVDGLGDASVLITAVDNVQPIMKRLLADRPRHILFPFHLI